MPSVLETMGLAEISQRVSFLDEERRKDKETIATLLERVEAQTGRLEAQKRQIQELEGLLANARAELTKFTRLERAMEQLRQELTLLMERNEEKRDRSLQELHRLRQVEQDTLNRQLADFRQELKSVSHYNEEVQSLQAEVSRLNASLIGSQHQLADLDKRAEDRVQSVIYLEEQRRQDNRRITQAEAELSSMRKGVDDLVDRLSLQEQAIQAKNKQVDRATELVQQQAEMIESQHVSAFRWERQANEWAKLVEEIKQETASMVSQTVRLREQTQLISRALADLESFRERIERRQNEMAEMQRLGEDRQKRVMEEWQTGREKEWGRFKLDSDERWRENARFNEKRHARLEEVEEFLRALRAHVEALWGVHDAWAQSVMTRSREWGTTWGEVVKQRPAMPEPLKPVSLAPEEMPRIQPLPSARVTKGKKEKE